MEDGFRGVALELNQRLLISEIAGRMWKVAGNSMGLTLKFFSLGQISLLKTLEQFAHQSPKEMNSASTSALAPDRSGLVDTEVPRSTSKGYISLFFNPILLLSLLLEYQVPSILLPT